MSFEKFLWEIVLEWRKTVHKMKLNARNVKEKSFA